MSTTLCLRVTLNCAGYLGFGYAALFATGVKSLITLAAHSRIPWDKPFYKKER